MRKNNLTLLTLQPHLERDCSGQAFENRVKQRNGKMNRNHTQRQQREKHAQHVNGRPDNLFQRDQDSACFGSQHCGSNGTIYCH
jgi:hypothetical protein